MSVLRIESPGGGARPHGTGGGACIATRLRRARRVRPSFSAPWSARHRCSRCFPRCSAACSWGARPAETFSAMLDQLVSLTGSEYGFIGEVLHDEAGASFLRMHGLSDISWSPESRSLFERMRTGGFEFHNLDTLFGSVVRTAAPVICNSPKDDARGGGAARPSRAARLPRTAAVPRRTADRDGGPRERGAGLWRGLDRRAGADAGHLREHDHRAPHRAGSQDRA